MTREGFVKLPRSLLDWQWLGNSNTLVVYIVLLLSANWKDTEWQGVKLKRGQLITGRVQLAEKCHLSEQNIRTALNHLKSTNEITIETTSQYSIITINNYDFDQQDNQQINQPLTNDQPSANQPSTTVEEVKEEKETKEKREEAAAPPPSPLNTLNSSSMKVTKEELTARYGSENVSLYERKFDVWADRKGVTGNIDRYAVIAKWLAEDGVTKPHTSSFNSEDVMAKIIGRYKGGIS